MPNPQNGQTHSICCQFADKLFECDHFVELAFKGLKCKHKPISINFVNAWRYRKITVHLNEI